MAEALVIEAAAAEGADAPVEMPEYLAPDAPEQAEEESPAQEVADPYEGLSPEEIAAKAREGLITAEDFQTKLREHGTELRKRWETEANQQAMFQAADRKVREDAAQASQQGVTAAKQRLIMAIENGEEITDAFLDQEFRQVYAGASLVAFDQLPLAADVALREGNFSAGIQSLPPAYQAEFHKARADRLPGEALKVLIRATRQMQHEATMAWAQNQAVQAQSAEAQAAEAAKKLQTERNGAKAPVSPTGGRGAGSRATTNRQILDTARPGSPEYARAYEAEHGYPAPKP